MLKRTFFSPFLLLLLLLCVPACVRRKMYRAELATRSAAEGREKVLKQELADRKAETSTLIDTIGSLNRVVGYQGAQLSHLTAELDERTQQMGKSASKLTSEKIELEKELATAKAGLSQCNDTLHQIQQNRRQYDQLLHDLQSVLATALQEQQSLGVAVTIERDAVMLLLPDKVLFELKGMEISVTAKPVLTTLAVLMTSRPDLNAEIIAYTDNVLPKDKTMRDTWTWSLFRATSVVRTLVQDYNVNANQLTPVGRGEFYPLTSNETPEGRQQNRRTVIVLHPPFPTGK